jgi:hypothetical protein
MPSGLTYPNAMNGHGDPIKSAAVGASIWGFSTAMAALALCPEMAAGRASRAAATIPRSSDSDASSSFKFQQLFFDILGASFF